MKVVSKREWDIMKRPIYPNIHFGANRSVLQAQTMLTLGNGYYYPVVLMAQMKDAQGIISFGEKFLKSLEEKAKMEINEEDEELWKIEG